MMLFVGALCAIIVLLFVVAIHELGHMLMAKLFGVGVVEYSIGMGPVLWWKRFKDTVYSVRALPFGGYCAMYGEESMEASGKGTEEQNEKPKRSFGKVPVFKTDWRIDQTLLSKPWWQRLLIYLAGPVTNGLIGVLVCFIMVVGLNAATMPVVDSLMEDHPAESVGILPGDVICGVNDREVMTWSDYSEYLDTHEDLLEDGYEIRVRRGDEVLSFHATRLEEDNKFGVYVKSVPVENMTVRTVVDYTGNSVRYMFHLVFDSLRMLSKGEAHLSDMSGMIGVTAVIADTVDEAVSEESEAAAAGEETDGIIVTIFSVLVFMTAMLCVNLGVINMLPIPALDGGRSVMCLVEGMIRRKIPQRVEYAVNLVGMCLMMALLVYTLFNDLARIFTGVFFG